jgi:hypothetical protein
MRRNNFWLSMILIFPFLSGCCGEIWVGKQAVNVQPLYNTQLSLNGVENISDIIDASIFDWIEIQDSTHLLAGWSIPTERLPGINSSSGIVVSLLLFDDVESAQNNFTSYCTRSGWTQSGIEFFGDHGNQYCISYIQQYRQAPDALCQPTNQYVSFVVFQKDRLQISIDETVYSETGRDLVFGKDAVILKLVEELAK